MKYTVKVMVSAVVEVEVGADDFSKALESAEKIGWNDILKVPVADGFTKTVGISSEEWYLED